MCARVSESVITATHTRRCKARCPRTQCTSRSSWDRWYAQSRRRLQRDRRSAHPHRQTAMIQEIAPAIKNLKVCTRPLLLFEDQLSRRSTHRRFQSRPRVEVLLKYPDSHGLVCDEVSHAAEVAAWHSPQRVTIDQTHCQLFKMLFHISVAIASQCMTKRREEREGMVAPHLCARRLAHLVAPGCSTSQNGGRCTAHASLRAMAETRSSRNPSRGSQSY